MPRKKSKLQKRKNNALTVFPKTLTTIQRYKYVAVDDFSQTTPTLHSLVDIDTGSLYNNRVGNSIFVSHIMFTLIYCADAADGTNTIRTTILNYPGQDVGSEPATFHSVINLFEARVLYDNVLSVSHVENENDGQFFNKRVVRKIIPVRKRVNYTDNDGEHVCMNAITLAHVSDSGVEYHPTVQGIVYVFYQ